MRPAAAVLGAGKGVRECGRAETELAFDSAHKQTATLHSALGCRQVPKLVARYTAGEGSAHGWAAQVHFWAFV